MHEDTGNIGLRLRELRRWRGLTVAELGGLAGVTASQVSMWENGRRPLDRRSHIASLAAALKVSETELTGGPHLSIDPQQSGPHAAIPALRLALQTNRLTQPAVDRARPLAHLAAEVGGRIERLRRECDYVTLGPVLPDVIDELHFHVAAPEDEAALRMALAALADACIIASGVAKHLNYPDLAHLAALRAEDAAVLLNDPVQKGKADYMWLLTLPRSGSGSWQRNLTAAEHAASELEPHARDPISLSVLGMVTLAASLAAASCQRGDTALHWLKEAKAISTRVPDDPVGNWQYFSATNAAIWRVAVAVERGEPGAAVLGMSKDVNVANLKGTPLRRAGFFADVGRSLAREPRMRDQAVRWLRRAEDAAPQLIRNNAAARETVIYLRDRELAHAARELRGMAARMGIPA